MDPFELEIYFAKHEFTAKYLLCCSDTESLGMHELLSMADDECKSLWSSLTLGYTETQGHPLLREEIAKQFYSSGKTISATNVRCFAGAEEAIYATFRAILNPGDEVIAITPAYQSLLSIPKACGAILTNVDLEPASNWSLSLPQIERAIASASGKVKLMILNFPHNPTGAMINIEQLTYLVEICRRSDVTLFCDEVYRDMETDVNDKLPPISTLYEKGISLGVLSKSVGLAGLRIGWIASQNVQMLNDICNFKHYLSICNSAPSEILGLIALRNYQAILSRNRRIVADNLVLIQDFLERRGDRFDWIVPRGGCIGFMKYKGNDSLEVLSSKLQSYGVLILPGNYFPGATGDYSQYFRFGFGRASFAAALLKLEEALDVIQSS